MKENNQLYNFIKERSYLVWHVDDLKELSEKAIVEAVLNYGDFDDVKKLITILSIKKVATIFREQIKSDRRCNYRPKTKNYFQLYFNKYA